MAIKKVMAIKKRTVTGHARMTVSLIIVTLGAFVAAITLNGTASSASGDSADDTQGGDHVEVLVAALAMFRYSDSLAETGAVASNAGMTRESVVASMQSTTNDKARLRRQLELLEGRGYDDRVSRIGEYVESLISNVDEIEQARPDLLRAMLAGAQNREELGTTTPRELLPAIEKSLDDQFYYMVAGRSDSREADKADTETLTQEEFLRYYHLATLLGSSGSVQYSLLIAAGMTDPTLVARLEESFDSSAHRMTRSIEYLSENGGPELDPNVIPLAMELINAGAGQDNYFDALKARLAMAENERHLIAANKRILNDLHAEIDALVQDIDKDYATTQKKSG